MKKGSKMSLESRKKISIATMGNKRALGYKHTEKARKKMSVFRKGRFSGEKCHLWKGGISQNKDYVNWQKNLYHYRKRTASGSHTFGEWENLKAQYNWTCPCCGKHESEKKLTKDHIIPISKGGSDNIENIQPLCLSCNIRKHTNSTKYDKIGK